MCASMVDIQSAMGEIRWGKKRKMEATTGQKYNGPAITTNSIGKALEVISTTLQLALLIYSFQFRSACLPQWPACRNCGMFILISLLAKNKVTIHPGFSRTVPFKDVSRKKITVLPGHPCPIFGLLSRVYLNTDKLHYFTVWIPILTYWSPKSERLKCICEKIAGGRGSAPDPAWGAHDAPPGPQVRTPDGSRMWRLHLMTLVPDCGAQIMVTWAKKEHFPPATFNFDLDLWTWSNSQVEPPC